MRSEARTGLDNQLVVEMGAKAAVEEAQTVIEEAKHKLEKTPKRLAREWELETEIHNQNLGITRRATDLGTNNSSYIAAKNKEMLDELELRKRWVEIEQNLKSGFVFAQKEYQYIQMFKEYLFQRYEERKLLQESNGIAKDDQLKLLNSHIRVMEKSFREQQKRLLQAPTPKELPGGDEDSDE